MQQPKNGLINLVNKQGNRSDNDAPQDQCCFVVFVSFSGGLAGPKGCVGLVRWVNNRLLGPRDCHVGQQQTSVPQGLQGHVLFFVGTGYYIFC